jgi:hypothetical protein
MHATATKQAGPMCCQQKHHVISQQACWLPHNLLHVTPQKLMHALVPAHAVCKCIVMMSNTGAEHTKSQMHHRTMLSMQCIM